MKRFCNVSGLTVGVPTEIYKNEKRVALTPEGTERLIKAGFRQVNIESGAGINSSFSDEQYKKAGATIVSTKEAYKSNIVLKVRGP